MSVFESYLRESPSAEEPIEFKLSDQSRAIAATQIFIAVGMYYNR